MGNDPSRPFDANSQNGMYIRTDKPFYFAGEKVTGNIYLNVAAGNFPSSSVHLKVKGSESCKWTETKTVWETVPNTNPPQRISKQVVEEFDGENDFYKHKITVHNFSNGFIPGGQYKFPFEFHLKDSLPGTFERKGHDFQARIRYKVKADVDSKEKQLDRLKNSQDIIVREPIKEAMNSLEGSQVVHPKTFCCIPQGTTSFKCRFDKNSYLPGENANLFVEIDNSQCDLNIRQVNCYLSNTLTMFSKQGKSRSISRRVGVSSAPGVRAKELAKADGQKSMTLKLVDHQSSSALDPTTNGKVVMNNYQLASSAELDGCCLCCQGDPGLSFGIRIAAAPLPSYDLPVVAPSGWNPQVMPAIQVEFRDDQLYQPVTGGVLMPQPQQGANNGYQNPNQPYYG